MKKKEISIFRKYKAESLLKLNLSNQIRATFLFDVESLITNRAEQYICHVFKFIRIFYNLNQKDLALILEVSQGTISKIENRKMLPETSLLLRVITKLEFPFSYFIHSENVRN